MWTDGVLLVLTHPQIKTSSDRGDFAMRAIPAVLPPGLSFHATPTQLMEANLRGAPQGRLPKKGGISCICKLYPLVMSTVCYWKWPFIDIYSEFSHKKWWFSIAMLNYQGAVLDREFLDWGYLSYTWLYKQGYIAITKNFVDPNMIYPGPSPGHQTTEGGTYRRTTHMRNLSECHVNTLGTLW